MRKFLLNLFLVVLLLSGQVFGQAINPGKFSSGGQQFLLNGKPFVIRAAELHYPRIPREYWEHRIQLSKAMGMNTVCIYLFWNIHEQKENEFDFKGQNDVAEFVRLVQKNGMYCIVRPGPYVCAEWDMGGLPWWLLKKKDISLRDRSDSYYMERTKKFFNEAGKQLAPLQIQHGGNIIMVQVENEYATYGNDGVYMAEIRDAVRASGFDKVELFRCDWSSNFNRYKLDGVTTTLNFGAGSNIDQQFKEFKKEYPDAPLMCSEYWTGWFDHWGKPHETRSVSSFIGSLKDMMDRKVSFSLYMAHGGTSFAQWGGANAGPYSAMVSSYDYNAPIGEQGNTTDKFFAVRDLLKNYLQEGESLGEIPAAIPMITIPSFDLKESAALFHNLPKAIQSVNIKPMEDLDQGWGRILYRTQLKASKIQQQLLIDEVHDWATVFIDGKLIGKLDRRRGDNTINIPSIPNGGRLDILVEATGRVNYGKAIHDNKGITKSVLLKSGSETSELKNWTIYNFPNDHAFQQQKKYTASKIKGPGWYKGNFQIKKKGDTYLDMSSWGKGMVWVNGYNLGRFWKIGPQQTMYLPGVWLKEGSNEIIVLDVDEPAATKVQGVLQPILDRINPDASLLHREKGQDLKLIKEKAVYSGALTEGNGWKEIILDQPADGRYVCLAFNSAQQKDDPMASMAEIELVGTDGKVLSTLQWKVLYASSEEITSGNHGADKLFDLQESTYWQSQSIAAKPDYPHQVVLDLGRTEHIKGIRMLPRADKRAQGQVKDFNLYIKKEPFIY